MKKLFGIAICIVLLTCALVPALAFAETEESIHFLKPTAIAALDNTLYVADNIEAGKSVIRRFDVSGAHPVELRPALDVAGDVVNLSAKFAEGGNGLYAVLTDKVTEFTVDAKGALTARQTFTFGQDVGSVINFVYGVFGNDNAEYFATKQKLFRYPDVGITADSLNNVADIVCIGDYLYYLQTGERPTLQRYDGKNFGILSGDVVNAKLDIKSSNAKGLFVWDSGDATSAGYFSDDAVRYVSVSADICDTVPLFDYTAAEGVTIEDVTATDGKVCVLNSEHKVEIFKKGNDAFRSTDTIGTDTVRTTDGTVPDIHSFTSFTLVQCVEYPGNIIFKTSDPDSGIDKLIDDAEQYIVLGYDGDDKDDFYYVLIGDKFGWVQKSGAADTKPQNDGKLRVIDTSVSQGIVQHNAKFVSLNAVWVYPLPCKSFPYTAFNQTATTRKDVTLLQRFTEGDTVWYYVRYDGNKLGFVTEENIGQFYLTANTDGVKVEGDRKANGTLFGYVQLYNNNVPETMNDDTDEQGNYLYHALNEAGEEIRHLGSGTRVTLIESYENGTALVQVLNKDGTTETGYCFADRLIPVGALTTNAVFGLVVTSIAAALAVTLTVVFVQRNKHKQPKDKTNSEEE